MAGQKDLISIIVRTKDRPKLLSNALSSIRKQVYRPIQVVLVNDGGTSLDVEDMEKTLEDVALHYIFLEKNVGRACAANIGIREATGVYIGFLDDDDEFYPDHLEALWTPLQKIDYMVAYADVEILHRWFDPQTGQMEDKERKVFASRDFSFHDLLVDNYIPLNSILFDRRFLLSVGGLDESFDLYEDWDLLIRCGSKQPFYHVHKVTAKYIQWSAQLQIAQSGDKVAIADRAYDQVLEKHWDKFGPASVRHILGYRKENEAFKSSIRAYEAAIQKANDQLTRSLGALDELRHWTKDLQATIHQKDKKVAELETEVRKSKDRLKRLEEELATKSQTLQIILSSDGWKLLSSYYKLRDWLLPPGSRRLLWARMTKLGITNPRTFLKASRKENIRKFFDQAGKVDQKTVIERVQRKIETNKQQEKQAAHPWLSGEEIFSESIEHLKPPQDDSGFLIIDRALPAYDKDSGAMRMFQIVELLCDLGYRVTFVPDDGKMVELYHSKLASLGAKVIYKDIEAFLHKEGGGFRYVLLSRPEQAYKYLPAIRAYAINSLVIYDTVDLHWVRFSRGASVENSRSLLLQAERYESMELLNAACSDLVLTVTPEERKILLDQDPDLKVSVLPNIHEAVSRIIPFDQRRDLMFIGGFHHLPNEDAMIYFVNEVFPMITKRLTGVKLYIVGSDPTEKVMNLASKDVKVTGYVSEVTPYFEGSRVFVAPLRYGAGMKGKIGQSMSFGLPVVTTGIGAEGIGLVNGDSALIADGADTFAEAVVRLYQDETLWNRISRNAHDYLVKNFSKAATREKLSDILNKMVHV